MNRKKTLLSLEKSLVKLQEKELRPGKHTMLKFKAK